MEIQIRKCTAADAAFLAKSILVAGRAHVSRGIWEVVLNVPEEKCLQFLEQIVVTPEPHLFHYSCYFMAETADNIPVGSLGGYDPKKLGYQALEKVLEDVFKKMAMSKESFQKADERAARILACLPREIDNAWVIDSVATMEDFRHHGIAYHLLNTVMDEGRKQNYSLVQIVMYRGNEPALRLYKKLGFEVVEETQDAYFDRMIGSPGMLSFSKKL